MMNDLIFRDIGLKNENMCVWLCFQFEFVIDMKIWIFMWLVLRDEYLNGGSHCNNIYMIE